MRFTVLIRYVCGGCGWRWSGDFRSPVFFAEMVVIVPADVSPCCGEHAEEAGS